MTAASTARKAYQIKDAAELYGVHADTIRKAINAGHLRAKKVGDRYLIHASALEEWFDGLPAA